MMIGGHVAHQAVQRLEVAEEKVKKREEILKERKIKKSTSPSGNNPKPKEEVEYHETMGLQNAYHLAVSCPHPKLLACLESHKIYAD